MVECHRYIFLVVGLGSRTSSVNVLLKDGPEFEKLSLQIKEKNKDIDQFPKLLLEVRRHQVLRVHWHLALEMRLQQVPRVHWHRAQGVQWNRLTTADGHGSGFAGKPPRRQRLRRQRHLRLRLLRMKFLWRLHRMRWKSAAMCVIDLRPENLNRRDPRGREHR